MSKTKAKSKPFTFTEPLRLRGEPVYVECDVEVGDSAESFGMHCTVTKLVGEHFFVVKIPGNAEKKLPSFKLGVRSIINAKTRKKTYTPFLYRVK